MHTDYRVLSEKYRKEMLEEHSLEDFFNIYNPKSGCTMDHIVEMQQILEDRFELELRKAKNG